MQQPLRPGQSSLRYRQFITIIFAIGVISSGIGTVFLAVDYVFVYDTVNRFFPELIELEKENITDTARRITVYLRAENKGSRNVFILQYTITLLLNNHYIASISYYPNILIEPGGSSSITVSLDVTGGFADPILLAEQTGEWTWVVQYPMRVYVHWLLMAPQYWAPWDGVTEVI